MIQKMRGAIDPYTLGFLISIIGSVVAVEIHSKDPEPEKTTVSMQAEKDLLNTQAGSKAHGE